jgi:hypothetical protein
VNVLFRHSEEVFDIRTFGAIENQDIGPAVQSALNQVALAGGGRVYIPPGVWLWSTLASKDFAGLANNVEIFGEGSASIIKVGEANQQLGRLVIQNAIGMVAVRKLVFAGNPIITADCTNLLDLAGASQAALEGLSFYGVRVDTDASGIVRLAGKVYARDLYFCGCYFGGTDALGACISYSLPVKGALFDSVRFENSGTLNGTAHGKGNGKGWIWIGNQAANPPTSGLGEVEFRNCTFDSGAKYSVALAPQTGGFRIHRVAFTGCGWTVPTSDLIPNGAGIYVRNVTSLDVERGTFAGPASPSNAIDVDSTDVLRVARTGFYQSGNRIKFGASVGYVSFDEATGYSLNFSGGTPASLTVKTSGRELLAANVAALTSMYGHDGDQAYVQTLKSYFVFASNSSETVDHITVEATAFGGNTRWIRTTFNHADWRTKIANVYIDSVNGNDENQGIYTNTPGSPAPLRTAQELLRRWGRRNVLSAEPISLETNIHILNPINAPDSFELDVIAAKDTFIRILGENTTTLHSGSLDALGGFTPWNPTGANGGSPTIIRDSNLANWTPYIGKRIFFPVANSWAYILKDLGGHQARISVPQTVDEPNFNPIPTNSFPGNGDAYQIQDPVSVNFGHIYLDSVLDVSGTFGSASNTNIADLTIQTNPNDRSFAVTTSTGNPAFFYRCLIEGYFLNDPSNGTTLFGNCRTWGLNEISISQSPSGGMGYCGGALIRTDNFGIAIARVSGGLGDAGVLDYHTTIQTGYVIVHGGTQIRSISIWDAVAFGDNPHGHALLLGTPGHHSTAGLVKLGDRGNFPIFGSGAAGVGLWVGGSTQGSWEHLPNIYGTLGQFKLGSGGKARFFNEGAGSYSNPLAETYANLSAAQPGGFGGGAHNLSEQSFLIQAFDG